jgi:hypothetical protein
VKEPKPEGDLKNSTTKEKMQIESGDLLATARNLQQHYIANDKRSHDVQTRST